MCISPSLLTTSLSATVTSSDGLVTCLYSVTELLAIWFYNVVYNIIYTLFDMEQNHDHIKIMTYIYILYYISYDSNWFNIIIPIWYTYIQRILVWVASAIRRSFSEGKPHGFCQTGTRLWLAPSRRDLLSMDDLGSEASTRVYRYYTQNSYEFLVYTVHIYIYDYMRDIYII